MKTIFRMTDYFLQKVKQDLIRPHAFAAERVGFISVRAAGTGSEIVLLAENYHSVTDEDYVNDWTVGAMINQEAIRKALNVALLQPVGMFHVHMHGHSGPPLFSVTDLREQMKFVPDFFKVRRQLPHGAIVLSYDHFIGRIWLSSQNAVYINEFDVVGRTITRIDAPDPDKTVDYFV